MDALRKRRKIGINLVSSNYAINNNINDYSHYFTFNLFPQISCACRVSIALFALSLLVNFA